MARADTTRDIGQSEVSMLGIYLNDHLAGATAGTELAHRMARSHGDGQDGSTLRQLAAEIAQDRAALLDIMAALGIKVRCYKVSAAWIGEKAGRLKFNGRLLTRSPSATWKNWKCCGSAWRARPGCQGTSVLATASAGSSGPAEPCLRPSTPPTTNCTTPGTSICPSARLRWTIGQRPVRTAQRLTDRLNLPDDGGHRGY